MTFLRTQSLLAAAVAAGIAVSGCGGAGGEAAAGANANEQRDAARVKFRQCLRKNGVDIPDNPGAGGAGPRDIDQATLRKAQEACREFQQDAFGDVSEDQRQEFRDAFAKFSACMRKNDVDVPDIGAGNGPPAGGSRLDRDDPKVAAALEKCQDELPQGRPGGPGGPGNP